MMTDEDKKAAHRDQQQILKSLINQSVMPCRGENTADILAEQAHLLDLAFRRFVSNTAYYSDVMDYALAFKAQQQCRQTLQFINALEKHNKNGNGQPKS